MAAIETTEVTRVAPRVIEQAGLAEAPKRGLQNPMIRAYTALILGAVCIGFSAIFTKLAAVPGPVSAFYRVAIAAVVLAIPFILQTRRDAKAEADAKRVVPRYIFALAALAGFFFACDLGSWNTSLLFTSAANSTLLGNTSTLWVSIGALLIFKEKLSKRFWSGMALALVGAVIVVGRDFFEHPRLGLGDFIALGSSAFYTGYLLTTQRVRQYLGTLRFMWLSSAVAAVLLLAFVLVVGQPLTGYSPDQYTSLLGLALISHVAGWLSINYALGHLPAPIASVTLLSQPIVTALAAVPILGEGLSVYQLAGGLLVLLGIYIVNRR